MAKFYTRAGDDGYTGVLGKGRVPKNHPRIEAVGTIDEATAALGLARSICQSAQSKPLILAVQRDLYHLMAEVAATRENAGRFRMIDASRVAWLEENTDSLAEQVEMPKDFIVPGDSPAGAALSLARAIVRRAERRVSELQLNSDLENEHILPYLNRLSSLCFILELLENQWAGAAALTLAKDRGP